MNNLPIGRTSKVVVQELQNELLVYDLESDKVYRLNQTAAIIYQACDGKTTFADLKTKYKFSADLIHLALDELKKEDLIEAGYISSFAGMSRREAAKKIGLASMIALPIIASMVAPTAAHAASLICPNPFYDNIPNGCQVGATPTVSNSTCDSVSDVDKASICNVAYGSKCSSGKAFYKSGTCVQQGTYIAFVCVCSA